MAGRRLPSGSLCFFWALRTYVYVDGFNLYYGCLKGTPFRWLDPVALASKVLPNKASVVHLRYFTALVTDRGGKVGSELRQQTYLRAIQTLPNVSVHLGMYTSHPSSMPLASPPANGPKTARVIKTEEKGSDVNIAAWMLMDGFKGAYDQAALISNDSDLTLPVQMVRSELSKPVLLMPPVTNPRRRISKELSAAATNIRSIRKGALKACQFPPTLSDRNGTIRRPSTW